VIDHPKRFSQVAAMDERGKVHINCRMGNEKVSFATLKRRFSELLKAVGFSCVAASPFVRSSYQAKEALEKARESIIK